MLIVLIHERILISWFSYANFKDCFIRVICVYLLGDCLIVFVTALLEYIDLYMRLTG